jgi:hypothetical protein
MANKITLQHKRSSVTGNSPTAGQIAVGELAINFADKKLFTKDASGNIIELGGGSNWIEIGSDIYRNSKISVGSTAAPLSAIDVTGTACHNAVLTTGAIDLALGQVFTANITATTSFTFSNTPTGKAVTVVLHITNGGSQSVIFTDVKWPGGTAPTLTATGTDVLVFNTNDGGITWRGNIFGKDIK